MMGMAGRSARRTLVLLAMTTLAAAGAEAAVTPIGRMAFGGDILDLFEDVGRGLPPGKELDDVPVLQRLAQREALAGVISPARFFDVGVPEGYREAVTASPARA